MFDIQDTMSREKRGRPKSHFALLKSAAMVGPGGGADGRTSSVPENSHGVGALVPAKVGRSERLQQCFRPLLKRFQSGIAHFPAPCNLVDHEQTVAPNNDGRLFQ